MEKTSYVEIYKDIYWVGMDSTNNEINSNPYLIVDGEEGVLIDPGSPLDFEAVFNNVCSIIPLSKIKYVVLHHQDPDLCSSVPLFEQKGAEFKIITHWRTENLIRYYGIKSEYYIVNNFDYSIELASGRVLRFIPTPYLHFAGAITTYDVTSKILFSSDLFGAFNKNWKLYADEDYIERMKDFHEHYMPSNKLLRPIMQMLLKVDISMIAPQHGSIINNNIEKYINALMELECGTFLTPIKRNLFEDGGYKNVINQIIKRLVAIFDKNEVFNLISEINIKIDENTMEIIDFEYNGVEIWEKIFDEIIERKGLVWLSLIEPLINRLIEEYDLPVPLVIQNRFSNAKSFLIDLNKENEVLKETNQRLNNILKESHERLIKCPSTGLYNYDFFKEYLNNEIKYLLDNELDKSPGLIVINLDNISRIIYNYGNNEVDEILKNTKYIIDTFKFESSKIFRLQGISFAFYVHNTTKDNLIRLAEEIRNKINASEKNIEKITASIGLAVFDEIRKKNLYVGNPSEAFYNLAIKRVKLAKKLGMNVVCSNSSEENEQEEIGNILLVDNDQVNLDILQTFLEKQNYKVIATKSGDEAVKILEKENIDLIVSEIMLPQIDGFQLRERISSLSQTKNIPFIFLSYLKNDDTVKRAISLGVEHYFQKPYMISELVGIISLKVKHKGEE